MNRICIGSEQLKLACMEQKINYFYCRDCSICGTGLYHQRVDDELYFNSNCRCISLPTSLNLSSWEILSDRLNNLQSRKEQDLLLKEWGLKL